MADTSAPLASGASTSEGKGSKIVVILASVIAGLGTITTILDQVTTIIPASGKGLGMWLAVAGVVVASLTQIAYTVQRGWIKAAALKAGEGSTAPGAAPVDPAAAAGNVGK